MAALVAAASVAVRPAPARGAAGDLSLCMSPGTWLTSRHDAWRMGSAVAASVGYSVPGSDRVAMELMMHWRRVRNLKDASTGRGAVYYDATELGATALVLARWGPRNGLFMGAGPGYRRATRSRLQTVGPASGRAEEASHGMVLALTAGVQWRPWDRFGGALWTMLDASPGTTDVEGSAGATLSVFFWP